jgi:hypothetical protein
MTNPDEGLAFSGGVGLGSYGVGSTGPMNLERYRIFVLCECETCQGRGRLVIIERRPLQRCPDCRGEGRTRQEVATCGTPEALGVAIVTLGREGEFDDCPVGVLDSEGETGRKWLVSPWLPSPRNVSDAGRVLAKSRYA